MTVKELIKALKKLPSDSEVIMGDGRSIEHVEPCKMSEVVDCKDDDGNLIEDYEQDVVLLA
jgi:hypothetical protein